MITKIPRQFQLKIVSLIYIFVCARPRVRPRFPQGDLLNQRSRDALVPGLPRQRSSEPDATLIPASSAQRGLPECKFTPFDQIGMLS